MEKNYLLTYEIEDHKTYDWFETEEEMNIFIENYSSMNEFAVIEKTHILSSEILK